MDRDNEFVVQRGSVLPFLLIAGIILIGLIYFTSQKNIPDSNKVSTNPLTSNSAVPAKRLDLLQRGVDLSLWFRFPLAETDDYFLNYINDDDLNFIQNANFNHVRLSVAPAYIFDTKSDNKINTRMLGFVDKAISKILSHQLAVVVDIHDEKKTFENDIDASNFIVFWQNFAKHLTQFNTSSLYLELLNEPIFDGQEQKWLVLQDQLIKTVREQAPSNTIIATGANWGGIEGLEKVTPSSDKNIIYSFHFYEPSAFTHQAADWATEAYIPVANLEYPYSQSNCEQVLSSLKLQSAKDLIQEYCDKKWNKEEIAQFIGRAVNWSQKNNNVPIWVGEFGVYCKQVPKNSKLQWIKDVKDILGYNQMGWTLWAYDDCFGLGAKKENGQIKYDKEVLQILQ